MKIREERPVDAEAIRMVNLAAFETSTEADLVDSLRRHAAPMISLVAEEEANIIIGHIMFSPVTLVGEHKPTLMGLAPMAVVPARQRQGIGSSLVVEGLERCRRINAAAVVVLGHAEYYPRFGFVPASHLSLCCEYDVPEDVFMVRELRDGALKGFSGTIQYHPVFANL
jgi:putative acetyltransferase